MSKSRPSALEVNRRRALQIFAAAAAAGLSGCGSAPGEIVPYVELPEGLTPGQPLYFATAVPLAGFARGVLATNYEGRPTRLEGNPRHSASLGATDIFAQAAIMSLYEPDRAQSVRRNGNLSSWAAFETALHAQMARERERGGAGLRILTGTLTSPTLLRQLQELRTALPQAEALGVQWCATPLATLSAPRGRAHPCVYRGFCKVGCATNAKQSALNTFIPRALAAGAEIRDLAMVAQIEVGKSGLATGVVYHRDGEWRRQRAKNVIVAGYAIETPRLLLHSACAQHPDGLANSSGLVGKALMTHSNHAVWGVMQDEIRWYKGPPSMAVCEHWNYEDKGKDFVGGYAFMSQGPLPADHAKGLVSNTGMFGMALRQRMALYNHMAGLKIVGETLPDENNRVELSDELDEFGIPLPRVTFSYSENDRRLYKHSQRFMRQMLEAAGASDFTETESSAHLMGGCRMGTSPTGSIVNSDGRTWDIRNLWIGDGSVFPTSGGVNPSLTIYALAARMADRIAALGQRGEL